MFNKKIVLLIVLFCVGSLCVEANTESLPIFSKEEVYARLHLGSDMLDLEERAQFQELIDAGESLYPVFLEIMEEADDYHTIGGCLNAIIPSRGDKREVVEFLQRQVSMKADLDVTEDLEWEYVMLCYALPRLGSVDDMTVLYPLLEHKNERIRLNVYIALSKQGGREALALLQEKHPTVTNSYEKRRINDAIVLMEERLGTADANNENAEEVVLKGAVPSAEPSATKSVPDSESKAQPPGEEPVKQSTRRTPSPWKVAVPILGVLAVVLVVVFQRRRRA